MKCGLLHDSIEVGKIPKKSYPAPFGVAKMKLVHPKEESLDKCGGGATLIRKSGFISIQMKRRSRSSSGSVSEQIDQMR